MAYTQLASYNSQIGGGRRIAMPGIEEFGERMQRMINEIPQNVAERLKIKPSELESSLLATVEKSKD